MALFSSYMRLRGKTWHYRRRVPADLREYFDNLHEFTKSCKSVKQGDARTVRAYYDREIDRICLALRVDILTPLDARKKIDRLLNTRKFSETPAMPGYIPPAISTSMTLGEVADLYELENLPNWSSKTAMEKAGVFKRIKEKFGEEPVDTIKRQDVLQWRQTFVDGGYGVSTTNKYLSNLSGILKHAGKLGISLLNPMDGMYLTDTRHESEIRSAYSCDDIKLLFKELQKIKSKVYAKGQYERYWAPVICMYSGLRADESAQLYIEDIDCEKLTITVQRGHDKKVKNKSSIRSLPIHPDLLTLGFLVYLKKRKAEGEVRLFPRLKRHPQNGYSHDLVKWWSSWSRGFIHDPKKTFHSFRHSVADVLKQAEVDGTLISEILGHEVPSITLSRYGKNYSITKKLEAFSHIKYFLVPQPEIEKGLMEECYSTGEYDALSHSSEVYDSSPYSIDEHMIPFDGPDRYSYVITIGARKKVSECESEIDNYLMQYKRPDLYGYSELHQAIVDFVAE